MKKILGFVSAVLIAVSCSLDSETNMNYTMVSTFEYPNVNYPTVFGSDSTYFDATGKIGLAWNDMCFSHKIGDDGSFKGGFMLSYLKGMRDKEKPEGYVPSVYREAGNQLAKNNTYAVFFFSENESDMPQKHLDFLAKEQGTCKITQCWVNNTEAVYEAATKNFKPGDYIILKAKGYLDDQETGTAEIALARDTVVCNWTKFDLQALGFVDEVDFELVSSNPDIPACFCLEELTATVSLTY